MLKKIALWLLRGTGYIVLTREEYTKEIIDAETQLSRKNGYLPLTKEVALQIRRGDFIPKGESVNVDSLTFLPTREHEVYFCSQWVSDDLQSGPIYCGNIATQIAFTNRREVVGLCQRHEHRHNTTLKAT